MDVAGPYGISGCQCFDLVALVLFLVGDDEIGLECIYLVRIDTFRPADARFLLKPGGGVDAEFGDADDGSAEGMEQFGLGGNERNNPAGEVIEGNGSAQ